MIFIWLHIIYKHLYHTNKMNSTFFDKSPFSKALQKCSSYHYITTFELIENLHAVSNMLGNYDPNQTPLNEVFEKLQAHYENPHVCSSIDYITDDQFNEKFYILKRINERVNFIMQYRKTNEYSRDIGEDEPPRKRCRM